MSVEREDEESEYASSKTFWRTDAIALKEILACIALPKFAIFLAEILKGRRDRGDEICWLSCGVANAPNPLGAGLLMNSIGVVSIFEYFSL